MTSVCIRYRVIPMCPGLLGDRRYIDIEITKQAEQGGLPARLETSANSVTAIPLSEVPSRSASCCSRSTTSCGTFRRYSVFMLQYASE